MLTIYAGTKYIGQILPAYQKSKKDCIFFGIPCDVVHQI